MFPAKLTVFIKEKAKTKNVFARIPGLSAYVCLSVTLLLVDICGIQFLKRFLLTYHVIGYD